MKSLLLVSIALVGCVSAAAVPRSTTVGELLANGAAFHGSSVAVTGYLILHSEGDSVCETPQGICVSLELGMPWEEKVAEYANLYMKPVRIEGTFKKIDKAPPPRNQPGVYIDMTPNEIIVVSALRP
jgi:hypothetical protein